MTGINVMVKNADRAPQITDVYDGKMKQPTFDMTMRRTLLNLKLIFKFFSTYLRQK